MKGHGGIISFLLKQDKADRFSKDVKIDKNENVGQPDTLTKLVIALDLQSHTTLSGSSSRLVPERQKKLAEIFSFSSDAACMNALRAGDHDAFIVTFEKFRDKGIHNIMARQLGSGILHFDFGHGERRAFYKRIEDSVLSAKREIFRSGRGFTDRNEVNADWMSSSIEVERTALQKGVVVTRILTNRSPLEDWCSEYAALMEQFPAQLKVFSSFDDPTIVNVGIVDPGEPVSQIQFLFESSSHGLSGDLEYSSETGTILLNQPSLSRILKNNFVATCRSARLLTPNRLRLIGMRNLYFATGSNLSFEQMRQKCPSAQTIGRAVLYGWNLTFCVYAPHLDAMVAGIKKSSHSEDVVFGVVYSISDFDKHNLIRHEEGGYSVKDVGVHLDGTQDRTCVFTFVPINPHSRKRSDKLISNDYISIMLQGAREHGITELIKWLDLIGKQGQTSNASESS